LGTGNQRTSAQELAAFPDLDRWIQQNFHRVQRFGGLVILERNDRLASNRS